MTKECGFLEQLVISIIMLPNIVGRALCLGVMLAILKMYAAIVLLAIFAGQQLASIFESLRSKTKISKAFLGILTSFTSPCLIVKEQSKHFLVNGIIGSVLYVLSTWILYSCLSVFGEPFPESPLILECFDNITTTSILRCPLNATSEEHCHPGSFLFFDEEFTICPSGSQFHFLWLTCWVVTCLLALSLVSVSVLHYLINAEKRMMFFSNIYIDTCPERDASIKPFINDIMNGKEFEEVQSKAKEATGKPILELMIQSKRIHLTKVNSYSY